MAKHVNLTAPIADDLKPFVSDDALAFVADLHRTFNNRRLELLADPGHLDVVLAQGAARAGQVADRTMADVRDRVGLLAPARQGS